MPPPISLKRKRRDPAAQRRGFEDLQLDFLAGLRIVEKLGTARPTNHDSVFEHDDDLLNSLNWISLLLETDSSIPQRDIAAALSAEKGRIVLYLAKPNAQLPTGEERECVAILMRTLRLALKEDRLGSNAMVNRFTHMMSGKTLPELFRKLSRISTVRGRTPQENWEHFLSILPTWRQGHPKGETSPGFIQLAKRFHGLVHGAKYASMEMVETMRSFILYDECKPLEKMNADEKSRFTTLLMFTSALMIASTFFRDLITPGARFHETLDHDDLIFMYELYRRIYDIARYSFGCSSFCTTGVPFLVEALGDEGIDQFLDGKGGIFVHWVVRSHRQVPRTLYWAASPEVKVRRVLALDALALEDLEPHHYDKMARRAEVANLWTKGKPVTPILHAELQLIRYLERRDIPVVGKAVGMNQPPCWACHLYIRNAGPLRSPQWRMTHTTGKPRGPWMIPPGCPSDLAQGLLRLLDKRVCAAVEEYGFECCYDHGEEIGFDWRRANTDFRSEDMDSDADCDMPNAQNHPVPEVAMLDGAPC
ncbi:hypothetical protein LshimejAT787_1101020 [Lyophyllum shimeji]|uniref:Uncharacterized protein n=1 Tax=Lyophyllum shimeji TaxID=47721 RepID=A0A9P3URC4_LYOSH|nr:hypothetical protein LshimejAT787_1101020 [Lyophyllum shimeji]